MLAGSGVVQEDMESVRPARGGVRLEPHRADGVVRRHHRAQMGVRRGVKPAARAVQRLPVRLMDERGFDGGDCPVHVEQALDVGFGEIERHR